MITPESVLCESYSVQAGSRKRPIPEPITWPMPGYLNQGNENVYLFFLKFGQK